MATRPLSAAPLLARRLLQILVALVAVLILVLAAISLLPDTVWKRWIAGYISHKTGREVAIEGPVHVRIMSLAPSISIDGFRLQNAVWASAKPMVQIKHFEATVGLGSLLRFHPVFSSVRIVAPDVDLERDAQNRANWDFTSPGASKPASPTPSAPLRLPPIHELDLADGRLTANDAIRKLRFHGQISIAERARAERALNVRGSGSLNGKPFELHITGGPLFLVNQGKPYGFDTALTAADIKLDAHTEIEHAFDLGALESRFHLRGGDLADMYYLTGLALPDTPAYDVTGTVHRNQMKFSIDDFKGRLGGSDIRGKLSIDTDHPRPLLQANLTSELLNLADLAAPLGTQASPETKSGTLAPPQSAKVNPRSKRGQRASAAVSTVDLQSKESGYLLPDADLQLSRVRAMDADVNFDAASIKTAKLPMKQVRFHLLLKDGRLKLEPLEFTLPQGEFTGDVSIDAHQAVPVTDLDMRLTNVDLAQFRSVGTDSADAPLSGQLVGRIRLQGRGASVHKAAADANGELTFVVPHGEIRSAFAELAGIDVAKGLGLLLTQKDQKTQIRCGTASFHAENGDLKANTLLFDTTHVLVTGKGHINLKDEAINIELRGKPKQLRLVRIRAPIDLHGTLAHPEIGLKPGPLAAQAGVAVALGTLLTPVAALLAFVDRGLAKNADCAAVIAQASAQNHTFIESSTSSAHGTER